MGEKLEKVGEVLTLAGWAIELAKSKNYTNQVLDSQGDAAAKLKLGSSSPPLSS